MRYSTLRKDTPKVTLWPSHTHSLNHLFTLYPNAIGHIIAMEIEPHLEQNVAVYLITSLAVLN